MKNYELTVLVHPDLEMNSDAATSKVKDLLTKNGGTINKELAEGKKRLAYAIKGQNFALYFTYFVSLPPEAPKKIENVLNITDEVLRYLLVAEDPRKVKYEAKQAARKPHGEDAEEEGQR